ncbi:pyridoxamine 5'-phosphate oxidase family protein [Amycolatopsis nigrescens]|uniref:pyridoxamine 5'-phosphate oxidase family protein n=1 Tax=Amycolatopsis nigrescens TaxID=381445 RepID=UPI00036B015C|nr:pyridoxamine 5'-phosphate oxidase family protein [Amycolatopsis nigrescens]
MQIDEQVDRVLTRFKIPEFVTATRDGGVNTRPMSALWMPEHNHIMLTTPAAFPQKAFNIRRDGRAALLYSDFAGSGLGDGPAVLVQGRATAPDVVALPEDIPEFWRGVFAKNPRDPAEYTAENQDGMDWYYWRLPLYLTPERITLLPRTPAGGATEPPAPGPGVDLHERVADALVRYPTATFAGRDEDGMPFAVRAEVTHTERGGELDVRPTAPGPKLTGPTNLLWHRHGGQADRMSVLLVAGTTTGSTFVPERVPGEGTVDGPLVDWQVVARENSLRYLARRNLGAPEIDWAALAGFTKG